MKNFHRLFPRAATSLKFSVCSAGALATLFWAGLTPIAGARGMSPIEMLQSGLPKAEPLANATPEARSVVEQALRNLGGRGEHGGDTVGFGSAPETQKVPAATVSAGSGGFSPQAEKCTVCHNGHEISIPCAQTQKYLANHPGDTLGACAVTSTTNR